MLISAAAVAATVGGWVAMAASAASVPNTQAQAPNIPALEISAQSGLDTSRVVDTLAPAAQPRAPLAMTRSSR
jgi:hypothetical protein